jgi:hypothetical protein
MLAWTHMHLLHRMQMLKRSASRRLKWFIPKPEELRDQGLYLVVALILGTLLGASFGTTCYWFGATIPAYINFSCAGFYSIVLLVVPKCKTNGHVSAGVYLFVCTFACAYVCVCVYVCVSVFCVCVCVCVC